MEPHELLMTALRALGVYALMLVVVRLLGKRTVGNFSAFDLLVALMLGEVVDEMIYGDVTFLQGAVAVVVVALAKYGTAWLSYLGHGMEKVLEGVPTIIIRDGALQKKGMREELMNEKDVMSMLRQQSIEDVREVKLACVENDGEISIIKESWAETLRRGDVLPKEKKAEKKDTGGKEEPPHDKKTDTPKALDQ
jgi:uncharacterized membrane protein YcaP (DUF421 family)